MHRKKVLFLITKSNYGGAQRYVHDLAVSLDPSVYDVAVAVGGGNSPDGELPPPTNTPAAKNELAEKLIIDNIRVITIPGLQRDISFTDELLATFSIAKIIKKEKPDVLHVNSSKAGAIGSLLGRLFRVPAVIFTAHGWAFNEDRGKLQSVFFKTIHYLTVFFSHHTITVSNALKNQMNWIGVQNKMSIIHLGRNTPSIIKSRLEARGILETKIINSQANLTDFHTDFWIGTIAELHPIKRLNRAIDAIAAVTRKNPKLRYIIIGAGELADTLQQQVSDLRLEEHVFFTGSIDEASRFLPAFDLFLLPSKSESFGYVLLEAGLAELPVIATNVGGIPDIITHEETGLLIEPDNTPALTQAIERLQSDRQLRVELAHAHKNNALQFSLEKMSEKTTHLYESILQR